MRHALAVWREYLFFYLGSQKRILISEKPKQVRAEGKQGELVRLLVGARERRQFHRAHKVRSMKWPLQWRGRSPTLQKRILNESKYLY